MVKLYFFYQVTKEKQKDYFKSTNETIKPFWLKNGCSSYEVYQEAGEGTSFIKEMVFGDLPAMQKALSLPESSQEAKTIVELFFSMVINVRTKPYMKIT